MTNEQIKFWRNFFFRLFFFSSLVALFIFGTTELAKNAMMQTLKLSEQEFERNVMNSLMLLRVWLFFIILPAGITMHSLITKKK